MSVMAHDHEEQECGCGETFDTEEEL